MRERGRSRNVLVIVGLGIGLVACERKPSEPAPVVERTTVDAGDERRSETGGEQASAPSPEPDPRPAELLASLGRMRAQAELAGVVARDGGAKLWSTPELALANAVDALPEWIEGNPAVQLVRVMDVRDDVVLVGTLPQEPCSDEPESFARLWGWASREALLPMLARDRIERYEDGSATLVAAGKVPRVRDGRPIFDPWRDRHDPDSSRPIEVTLDELTFAFQPSTLRANQRLADALGGTWTSITDRRGNPRCHGLDPTERRACEAEQADAHEFAARVGDALLLRYACEPGDWDRCQLTGGLQRLQYYNTDDLRERDGDRLIRGVGPCLAFAAVSSPLPLTEIVGGVPASIGQPDQAQRCVRIRAPAPLVWPDDSEAGAVMSAASFRLRARVRNGRACTSRVFGEAGQPICAYVANMEDIECASGLPTW